MNSVFPEIGFEYKSVGENRSVFLLFETVEPVIVTFSSDDRSEDSDSDDSVCSRE